jgi:hypothetical protein
MRCHFNFIDFSNPSHAINYTYIFDDTYVFNPSHVVNYTHILNLAYVIDHTPIFNIANIFNITHIFSIAYVVNNAHIFNLAYIVDHAYVDINPNYINNKLSSMCNKCCGMSNYHNQREKAGWNGLRNFVFYSSKLHLLYKFTDAHIYLKQHI